MSNTRLSVSLCLLTLTPLLLHAAEIEKQPSSVEPTVASISIGALKDEAETTAVRLLARYGDAFGVSDRIVVGPSEGDRASFNNLSRSFEVDTSSQGKFGGISFRYGIKHYNVGMKIDPNAPPRSDGKPVIKFDGDKWMHVFPVYIGVDADRNFNNQDYLLEAGYIPALFKATDSCFKLGANPIVGISAQLGQRKRITDSTAEGKTPETSGDLRRIKIEGKMDFSLSCILPSSTTSQNGGSKSVGDLIFSDIGTWQVIITTANWRDYVENRTYNRHQLLLRIPTGAKSFIDLKREIGAAPTNYDTGAKFSAGMTLEF